MHTVKKNILVGLSQYILSLSTLDENHVFYRIVILLVEPLHVHNNVSDLL